MKDSPARVLGVCLGSVVLLSLISFPSLAAESIKDALKDGKANADLRYRAELVDQDGVSEDAQASTLRLRLGYKTDTFRGLFAHAEFEGLKVIGAEQYNSTANGLTQFPVVVDPEDEEINQAYIGYTGLEDTTLKLGRQRIKLDNDRFVGNVGWRQLEQTYDAFSLQHDFNKKIAVFYAHLNNANRVFGEHHPVPASANTNLSGDLLNASFKTTAGKLTAYAYLLELEDDPAASHQNVGLRFSGSHAFENGFKLLYTAELADQSDYKDGASTIDAGYHLVEAGAVFERVTVKLGYEVLEGDGVYAFQTPLATLHAFNGWTDKFLSTPPTGLEDTYLSVSSVVAGIRLMAVLHDFSPDAGGADYGSELGLVATKTFKKSYTVGAKYASFDADSFTTDTEKLWITLGLKL